MERTDYRIPTSLRKLREWRMVARPEPTGSYWGRNRKGISECLGRLVERADCVTLRTSSNIKGEDADWLSSLGTVGPIEHGAERCSYSSFDGSK